MQDVINVLLAVHVLKKAEDDIPNEMDIEALCKEEANEIVLQDNAGIVLNKNKKAAQNDIVLT